MVRAWHRRSIASVNQTWMYCVNQMGKTHSKLLAARHGKGTAWARHATCESAFGNTIQNSVTLVTWQLVFVHPCHKAPSYITLSFQVLVFFVPKILSFFCFLTPDISIPLLHRESVSQPQKTSDKIVYHSCFSKATVFVTGTFY